MRSGLKVLAGLVLFHLGLGLFLLWYDERLNPGIPAFLQDPVRTIDERDNAYFAFAGFDARPELDSHAAGRQLIGGFLDEFQQNPLLAAFDREVLLGPKLSFQGENRLPRGDERLTYFPAAAPEQSIIEQLQADNRDLVDRYAALYDYSHFHETTPGTLVIDLLPYLSISHTHRLMLWAFALEAQSGDPAVALNLLRRDTAFWRMVLRESQDLLTRLVALREVRRNAQLLAEMLAVRPGVANLLLVDDPLLRPLEASEKDLSPAIRREFAFNLLFMRQIKRDLWQGTGPGSERKLGNKLLAPMLKVNSSSNMLYEDFAWLARLAALPAPEFASEAQSPAQNSGEKLGCEFLYNLAGTVIFKLGRETPVSSYRKYPQKHHDYDGYIRLLNLRVLALQQQLRTEEIPAFLDRAPCALTNPYTGEPMQWDGERRSIYFESIDAGNGERQRVELLF